MKKEILNIIKCIIIFSIFTILLIFVKFQIGFESATLMGIALCISVILDKLDNNKKE